MENLSFNLICYDYIGQRPNLTTLVQIELTGLILRTIEGRMQQIKKMFSINKATHRIPVSFCLQLKK